MNVAIIPARGGSTRIPRKNTRLFHGKPIIEYSIEAARESGLFDSIYVSTDDQETMDIAQEQGCFIHLRSTNYLCGDEAGTQEVAQDCLLHSVNADYACCIYATAPLMRGCDLEMGFGMLRALSHTYRYVYIPGWFYWGDTRDFMISPAITPSNSLCLAPDVSRWADINTEGDWLRAERMYAQFTSCASNRELSP